MRCALCGGKLFREIEEGMHCRGCGAILNGSPDPGGAEDNFRDHPLERALENEYDAQLLAERFDGWG